MIKLGIRNPRRKERKNQDDSVMDLTELAVVVGSESRMRPDLNEFF